MLLRLGGGRLGLRLLRARVLAGEPLDAAGGVHELLLAREERVAARADLEAQLLALGGAGLPRGAARAVDGDFLVIRVNAWLHGPSSINVTKNSNSATSRLQGGRFVQLRT